MTTAAYTLALPTPEVRAELAELARTDPTRMKDVFPLYIEEGLSEGEIADRLGLAKPGIFGYTKALDALFNGRVAARYKRRLTEHAGMYTRFLKREGLSPTCREYLERNRAILLDAAEDADAAVTVDEAYEKTAQAEALNLPGVYVWTWPDIIKLTSYEPHPQGWLKVKVGQSANGMAQRVRDTARQTGWHQDPVLLRVYSTEPGQSALDMERRFHRLLTRAGQKLDGTCTGKEWFETSLDLLDEIADVLGLSIYRVMEAEELGDSGGDR